MAVSRFTVLNVPGFATIKLSLFSIEAEKHIYRVDIINQNGKNVFSQTYDSRKVTVRNFLPKGIYFVKIYLGHASDVKGTISRKVVIE